MSSYYDSDRGLAEYLLFHYGDEEQSMPWPAGPRGALNFPRRCVTECLGREPLPPLTRALDLGCAVGRTTFELARLGADVIGIDASARFVAAARQLLETGEVPYQIPVEGGLTQPAVARLPRGVTRERVRFETGDALRLRPDLGDFDVVVAANLLDRVPRPRELLARFETVVRAGGHLVLTSPYTWLEEYTPREEWLCRDSRRTSDVLAECLPGFQLLRRLDLPFILREHARKFQWSVAEATVWQRV